VKLYRFLLALTLLNIAVLLLDLAYTIVAGWLPGS
jgi:hypothetical protein